MPPSRWLLARTAENNKRLLIPVNLWALVQARYSRPVSFSLFKIQTQFARQCDSSRAAKEEGGKILDGTCRRSKLALFRHSGSLPSAALSSATKKQ